MRPGGRCFKFGFTNFNPRTPCGVRLGRPYKYLYTTEFQSTHPLRGATVSCALMRSTQWISIHAPLAGCDWNRGRSCPQGRIFQSTHPLRGATCCTDFAFKTDKDFNPRTPCGVRRKDKGIWTGMKYFNPRTPCGVRQQNCRNIPGKFAQKLQNFCKAKQRAALSRVGQRESGRYFRPCAVRTSRGKPERFRFASDNERALRSVARL